MREAIEIDVEDFNRLDSGEKNNARFFYYPKKDEVASAAEGRPIFKEIEVVEIVAAGNQNNIVVTPVQDKHRFMFRRQYEAFKSGDMEQLVGTPLTEVPWITRGQVEELAYRKVRTLEALAAVSDQDCNIPGWLDLRRKAQAWLKKSEDAAPFTAMQAEMEALRKQNEELMLRFAALEEGGGKKPKA